MYCRMCGKKIGDMDHFCQFCGTPTENAEPSAAPSETKEEIIFNPPYEDKSHITEEEELKEYISENEIEEAQQEEVLKKEETDQPEPIKNPEFAWNVYEFPTEKKKTEDVEFNWNTEEFGPSEQKDADVKEAAFEEELFQEIRDDSNRIKEQNIDRFFTFSRKNEEFQELLDKEYEKFNMRPAEPVIGPAPEVETAQAEPQATEAAEEHTAAPEIEVVPEVVAAQAEPQVKVIKESGIPEAVPLQEIHIEPETPEEEPAIEPEIPEEEPVTELGGEDLFESAAEPEPEVTEPEAAEPEAVVTAAEPEPETAKTRAEHISEMEQARAQYFGEELIRDNESIRKKLTAAEPAPEPEPEKASEPEKEAEPETEPEQEPEPEPGKPVEDYIQEEKEADNRAESVAAAYAAAAALEEAEDQTPVPPLDDLTAAIGEVDKGEDEKHKRSVGQVVLAIIAIILVIEIAILGIRYFAPESSAAKAIGSVQKEAFNTVLGWFGGGGDQADDDSDKQDALPENGDQTGQDSVQQEETQTDDQTKAPAADSNPMADKNALVTSQMGNNKNIEQVKANEALAWQQGKNYGLSDINNSMPITNNIWQAPETGDPIYYDKSVVGTIIAFDSQWIDYVNSGEKNVLALIKKDSEAYRKSVNYSKVGKIKETFKLLEIGEIRQGANGFYIWVHEEIGATEKGKTSDMKYNWIYYLEPVDGQMKIVNYYHF